MVCGSVEQGGVRAGSPCSCVLGFAGAPGRVVLALPAVEAVLLELAGSPVQTQGWSWVTLFVSGLWSPAAVSQLLGRDPHVPILPPSLAGAQGWAEVEVMGLEKKGRERRSRNAQARSNGKSVTAVLQSNTEPGA